MKTSTTTEGVPRCASTNTCSPQNRETASVWFLGTWAPSTRKAHAPPRARSHRASSCWSPWRRIPSHAHLCSRRCSSPRSSSLNFHVTLKQRDLWTPESLPKATLENKLEDEDRAPPTRGRHTTTRPPPWGPPSCCEGASQQRPRQHHRGGIGPPHIIQPRAPKQRRPPPLRRIARAAMRTS